VANEPIPPSTPSAPTIGATTAAAAVAAFESPYLLAWTRCSPIPAPRRVVDCRL
jgi:hypothetical protein